MIDRSLIEVVSSFREERSWQVRNLFDSHLTSALGIGQISMHYAIGIFLLVIYYNILDFSCYVVRVSSVPIPHIFLIYRKERRTSN